MERVKTLLLRQGILENRYRIERPYTWKFYEEQAEPVWIGEATTNWTLSKIIEEVPGI